MIERVARAICESRGDNPNRLIPEFGRTSYSYPAWNDYRKDARAAIEAMMKPTKEMEHSAVNLSRDELNPFLCLECGDVGFDRWHGRVVYQAMIDEALKDV